MTTYRILVTGSRDWDDEAAVWMALDDAITQSWVTHNGQVVVVHGDCPTGADEIADRYARDADCQVEPHPADWSRGRRAGPERNDEMVAAGADICLAFLGDCTKANCLKKGPHSSHGAYGCALRAELAGIEVRRFRKTKAEQTDG